MRLATSYVDNLSCNIRRIMNKSMKIYAPLEDEKKKKNSWVYQTFTIQTGDYLVIVLQGEAAKVLCVCAGLTFNISTVLPLVVLPLLCTEVLNPSCLI